MVFEKNCKAVILISIFTIISLQCKPQSIIIVRNFEEFNSDKCDKFIDYISKNIKNRSDTFGRKWNELHETNPDTLIFNNLSCLNNSYSFSRLRDKLSYPINYLYVKDSEINLAFIIEYGGLYHYYSLSFNSLLGKATIFYRYPPNKVPERLMVGFEQDDARHIDNIQIKKRKVIKKKRRKRVNR